MRGSVEYPWIRSRTLAKSEWLWILSHFGRARSASDLHFHTSMAVHFYCVEGLIEVSVGGCAMRRLDPGESLCLSAMTPHRLRFLSDARVVETCYALPGEEIDESDVIRLSRGWPAPPETIPPAWARQRSKVHR